MMEVVQCNPKFSDILFGCHDQAWVFYVFGYFRGPHGMEVIAPDYADMEFEPERQTNTVRVYGEVIARWPKT